MKIESATENDFLKSTFMTYSPSTTYWIGLNDVENEGVFQWSDGSSLNSYSNWFRNNPDNFFGNEDCVVIKMGSFIWGMLNFDNAQWNDDNCDVAYGFICKTTN